MRKNGISVICSAILGKEPNKALLNISEVYEVEQLRVTEKEAMMLLLWCIYGFESRLSAYMSSKVE